MTGKNWMRRCAITLALLLGGCSLFGGDIQYTKIDEDGNVVEEQNSFKEMPAQKLLTSGMDDYGVGIYFTAVEAFEEILDRYPFSREAILAELKVADCSYHMGNYQEAEALYENFEESHPTNESIPYVLYQKGMCNYRQIDRVDRDPGGAEKAVRQFKQLIKAFPNSPYTADAQEKANIAAEFLANHEFSIADFYVRTEKYPQAKSRLRYLLAAYPEAGITRQAQQLLKRLEQGDTPRDSLLSLLPDFFTRDPEPENTPQKAEESLPSAPE